MSPLLILALGIATVIGLILVLRLNAFLALIVAAIVVSVLSPGAPAERISRVAGAFGDSAGKIGIVIALAAVIGECMMRSGAADRIVQAFLQLLGVARASWALMLSGFVLGVPVFFDTVFYLLVPLARSLFRRTGRNYLLYLLAIGAGGAVTHTLVPPTPGPLVMAEQLGVNIGAMILAGIAVALPSAIGGLVIAMLLDRWLHVPYRSPDAAAEETIPETHLPPLLLALLPVVLPVLLISTDTVVDTWMKTTTDPGTLAWLGAAKNWTGTLGNPNLALLLSTVVAMVLLWRKVVSTPSPREQGQEEAQGWARPDTIDPHVTTATSPGTPNPGTTASPAPVLVKPLQALSQVVEVSLMSGGAIILITAAGGAFGAMLKVANVGPAIQGMFALSPSSSGIVFILLGYAIASLLKIAQGSSTVAMITASSMLAATVGDGAGLGFHPAYLATAIGAGSLMISWMNDSGFWIVAKMGGLTEAEALKSWTVLLAVISVIALGVTVALAMLVPMRGA